ncbi:MAG: PD-(D/E)XK nuclease family protein [Myxococcota bacterium]
MDMDTLREGLHVSVSQIKTYLRCPRQFFLRYVAGAQPEGTSAAILFGKAFHAALAALYGAIRDQGALPPLELVVQAFHASWEFQRARTVVEGEARLGDPVAKASHMLRVWLGLMKLRPLPTVLAVEKAFSVRLTDPIAGHPLEESLVGAFDLVVQEGGRPVIVEHKTAARRYGTRELSQDPQPTAYHLAARELGLGTSVGLRMQVFTKGSTPTVQVAEIQRTQDDERRLLHTVTGVLRAVDAGAFHPTPGWQCSGCPYQLQCGGAQ